MASTEMEISFRDVFSFKLHDKVLIKALEWKGIVKAILIQEAGIGYHVRYFINGEAKEVYFYAEELELIK